MASADRWAAQKICGNVGDRGSSGAGTGTERGEFVLAQRQERQGHLLRQHFRAPKVLQRKLRAGDQPRGQPKQTRQKPDQQGEGYVLADGVGWHFGAGGRPRGLVVVEVDHGNPSVTGIRVGPRLGQENVNRPK